MKLTKEQVLHIAKLARLQLSDAEVEKFQTQLSGILAYVDQLQEVDTAHVEPTRQVTKNVSVTRPDELLLEPLAAPEELLSVSPLYDEATRFIKVKKVFE